MSPARGGGDSKYQPARTIWACLQAIFIRAMKSLKKTYFSTHKWLLVMVAFLLALVVLMVIYSDPRNAMSYQQECDSLCKSDPFGGVSMPDPNYAKAKASYAPQVCKCNGSDKVIRQY